MEILLLESHALSLILCYFFHRAAYNDTFPRITYLRVLGQAVAGSYTGYRTCNATLFRRLSNKVKPDRATLRLLYCFGYQYSGFLSRQDKTRVLLTPHKTIATMQDPRLQPASHSLPEYPHSPT